jgi:carboxypeptidase C (cathepsin A)
MTGLPVDAITRAGGFIHDAYVKNLAAGEHKIVSHYDATFASDDPYPATPTPRGPDPILDGVIRAYGGAFVGYARDELGFKTDMSYILLASDIAGKWNWELSHGPASVIDDLRVLLALTPSFRLLIAHGYSDMVTPYAVSRYVLEHLPPFEGRTALKLYRGGHMFYLDPDSRKAFTADARAIYPAP